MATGNSDDQGSHDRDHGYGNAVERRAAAE
jgi:hypothetical protein